jgi:hypothetical protein
MAQNFRIFFNGIKLKMLDLRFLFVALLLILTVMLIVTLYPFNFFPANGVQWLSNEPGLYFNGKGIAYTDKTKTVCETTSVSVVLLLKERFGSKNWGPNEIFSFYDDLASPPLTVGQWGGHIFLYSRFEKNWGDKWYRLFRTKHRFPRGKPHLVTVTFGDGVKAIYIDGKLDDKRRIQIHDAANVVFCGRLIIGNSPTGWHGWWGEVKGLAIYDRVLLPKEIIKHYSVVLQRGMRGLVKTPGCLALYPLDEGKGIMAKSIVGECRRLHVPISRTPLLLATLFHLRHQDMRVESLTIVDLFINTLFFVPYGFLFSTIIFRKYNTGLLVTFLMVIFTGSFLSFTIEFLQLFLPTRISGITDVFSNTIGTVFGVCVAYLLNLTYLNR